MFTTLGLFGRVPCPEQDRCYLPNCLFHHRPRAGNYGASKTSQGSTSVAKSTTDVADDHADEPLVKRRKIEITADSSQHQSTSTPKTTDTMAATALLFSAPTPVSPPPLRARPPPTAPPPPAIPNPLYLWPDGLPTKFARNTPPQTPANETSSTAVNAPPKTLAPESSNRAINTPSKTLATETSNSAINTPLKTLAKETLNPRYLPSPPAKHDLRLALLKKFHEQLVRLNSENEKLGNWSFTEGMMTEQELITMALDEEQKVAMENRSIYSNVFRNRIVVFMKMQQSAWLTAVATWKGHRYGEEVKRPKSREIVDTGLSPAQELVMLLRLIANVNDLPKLGYVMVPPTAHDIDETLRGLEAARGWEECDRCKTRFQVFPGRREDGQLSSGGACTHHWGKPYMPRDTGETEKRFGCCQEPLSMSVGCATAERHVFKAGEVKRMAAVLQFEETPPNANVPVNRAVCLDCEMCYTVYGMELVRVTVTAWQTGEEMLDVLVRPMGEILDLNTRFSGITTKQLADARPYHASETTTNGGKTKTKTSSSTLQIVESPAAARKLVCSFISPQTPIIGHALENDMGALRLIHRTLVDTCLLFPHHKGLPLRNSLKNLARRHLDWEIQMTGKTATGNHLGHDSKEDANAAGELVRWLVGSEWRKLKRRSWSWDDQGNLIPSKNPFEGGSARVTTTRPSSSSGGGGGGVVITPGGPKGGGNKPGQELPAKI
ncbi:MAG: hypothetical protein M1823_003663 [Watsoniomyces obsoletus]|nr:MAG: hypothetical protein M1823_003663 [Watsoniomyces obsoletus]